jgi:hypothetical protein
MTVEWDDRKTSFEQMDVRRLTGNFLPAILKKARDIPVGSGICIVQTFEPIPLYSTLESFGFEHVTERVAETEFRAYFYRREKKEPPSPLGMDMPLKPTAILNFKQIDDRLAGIIVPFWDLIWGKKDPAIDTKTKLLLSLANGAGAGRYRQATRELIKAYALGVTVPELDELFSLLVWNQGVGSFASEIGPSPLFGAYRLIKRSHGEGRPREEILKALANRFGERNPDVATLFP